MVDICYLRWKTSVSGGDGASPFSFRVLCLSSHGKRNLRVSRFPSSRRKAGGRVSSAGFKDLCITLVASLFIHCQTERERERKKVLEKKSCTKINNNYYKINILKIVTMKHFYLLLQMLYEDWKSSRFSSLSVNFTSAVWLKIFHVNLKS